jgi:hypothetical protein
MRKGAAMAIVLIFCFLMTTIAFGLAHQLMNEGRSLCAYLEMNRAYYSAVGGVEWARFMAVNKKEEWDALPFFYFPSFSSTLGKKDIRARLRGDISVRDIEIRKGSRFRIAKEKNKNVFYCMGYSGGPPDKAAGACFVRIEYKEPLDVTGREIF